MSNTDDASALKILVVDDTPINNLVVTKTLARQGYTIQTAAKGEEAIKQFKSESPDLILMDVMMPGIGGL
jgi:two-component system response regulator MtrA